MDSVLDRTWNAGMISLFIPAFNAAGTLQEVIGRIDGKTWQQIHRVYLINDGSEDDTWRVMQDISRRNPRCEPVLQEHNQGYGATVKHGLKRCCTDGCSFAACLHADGQYPPESILPAVTMMTERKLDLLQGSRIASGTALSGGMPLYKFIAGKLLTALENRVFKIAMTDYHSGFLVYGRGALDAVPFERLGGGFDFDLEVIATARAIGLSIGEVPIPTRYAGERSYLNPVVYGLGVLRVVIRYQLGRYSVRNRVN